MAINENRAASFGVSLPPPRGAQSYQNILHRQPDINPSVRGSDQMPEMRRMRLRGAPALSRGRRQAIKVDAGASP
ncbi:hypothetical protein BGLA2_680018 [Burkholderia gladioli]|nr:hypothetical protein BGLA2_680018 [Burkholderia gladioli]